jgi:hypothetical protein
VAQLRRSQHVLSRETPTDSAFALDLRDVLPDWPDAACAGSDLFFPDEGGSSRGNQATGAALLPLLVCGPCPLRRRCLGEGFRSWQFSHSLNRIQTIEEPTLRNPGGPTEFLVFDSPSVPWTHGIWGGSTQHERWALRDVPVDEAVELLDSTYEERIRARVAAWRKGAAMRTGHGRFDKRISAILAIRESSVGRFHLGGRGGPGRGHKGAIATLATELKCSRDTAWRRLKRSRPENEAL